MDKVTPIEAARALAATRGKCKGMSYKEHGAAILNKQIEAASANACYDFAMRKIRDQIESNGGITA